MSAPLNTAEVESEQQQQNNGWGSRLRETRLARKISLAEITGQLHLETKLLEAIEAEDLENLPSPPFVKGYLRSYARLLDLNHESIIAAYNELSLGDSPKISRVSGGMREMSSSDKLPRYATWFVIAATIVSFVIWWSNGLSPVPKSIDVVSDNVQTQSSINTEVMIDQSAEMLSEGLDSESLTSSVVGAEETTAETDSVAPLRMIKLQFEQDSWAEISDARDERLFFDIGKAGESRFIEGMPPFKILFGNSPGVIMEYNGKLFDHRAYESKGIARFTLDN